VEHAQPGDKISFTKMDSSRLRALAQRFWVHDIKKKQERVAYGEYHHLFRELCLDGERFSVVHKYIRRMVLE